MLLAYLLLLTGCSSSPPILRRLSDTQPEGLIGMVIFIHIMDRMIFLGDDSAKFAAADPESVIFASADGASSSRAAGDSSSAEKEDRFYDESDPYFLKALTDSEKNPYDRTVSSPGKSAVSFPDIRSGGGWYHAVILNKNRAPFYIQSVSWKERFSDGRRKTYITYNVPLNRKQSLSALSVLPEPGRAVFLGIHAVQIRMVTRGLGPGIGSERRAFLVPGTDLLLSAPENIQRQIFGPYERTEEGARLRFFELLYASSPDQAEYWKKAAERNPDEH